MAALLKILSAACLVAMMLLTCVDVVGRHFRHPVFGSVEIMGFLATMVVAMALPYTHQIQGHIGVDIVVRLLPDRVRAIIDLSTSVLSLALFALVTWQMGAYARTMSLSGEVSMNLKFPEYVILYGVCFCFFVFFLLILRDILRSIRQLRAGR